ncbi:MAG: hypothetical protein ACI4UE_00470 [Candidatus Scatovivens sp.]
MKNKKAIFNILFIITLIILCLIMLYFIEEKEGFHEDEIFSYGSSNYKYDNVFQASGDKDAINRAIDKYVITNSFSETIKNIIYYVKNFDEFGKITGEIISTDLPVWKTPEDAKNYLTVSRDEIFSYWPVYYNQSRDVHPPLFYFLVHFVSSIFLNTFSKYIIFIINLIFFIGICLLIRKILKLYDKEYLSIPAIILYGGSIGAISTVIFQRMYTMLAFFCIYYLYINLKIIKNNFKIDKKLKWQLVITTLLGFLTQYYFCIYAVFIFSCMFIKMIKEKNKENCFDYFLQHIKAAIIGIILYPASIYHIFFSYRGVGNSNNVNFISKILYYIKEVLNAYSLNCIFGYILAITSFLLVVILLVIKRKKIKEKFTILLLTVPVMLFILVISKISPNVSYKYTIRYVTAILPVVAISIIFVFDNLLKSKKISIILSVLISLIISIIGLLCNEPKYLYTGYNEYIKIAEKYKKLDYVYVCDNGFTHINSLPEFMIYNKSLIININHDNLDFLKEDEQLQSQKEFVLSIKKWMNTDDVLNKILEKTGFYEYELILDDYGDIGSKIYLIKNDVPST